MTLRDAESADTCSQEEKEANEMILVFAFYFFYDECFFLKLSRSERP